MSRQRFTILRTLLILLAAAHLAQASRKDFHGGQLSSGHRRLSQQEIVFQSEVQNYFPASLDTDPAIGAAVHEIARGGGFSSLIPAGYNPFGYQITELGTKFLEFEGSLDSDVGRFLASLKSRKRFEEIKSQWLEIVRVSKTGQSMRIYRSINDLISFCIKAKFLD